MSLQNGWGLATTLRAGRFWVRILAGETDFLSPKPPIPAVWPTQSRIQWVSWFFAGCKAAGAEVKREWVCTAPPIYRNKVEKDEFLCENT